MVRRKNVTIFLDARENTTVLEIKKMIAGITKRTPDEQLLIKDDLPLGNDKCLADYNINNGNARAQSPITLGLCFLGKFYEIIL